MTLDLRERHYLILMAVGNYKYLTWPLVAALLIHKVQPPQVQGKPTGEVIGKAMTALFNHGYLLRPKSQVQFRQQEQGSHKLIYALSPKGKAALELEHPGSTQDFVTASRESQTPALLHTLMIARFRVTLYAALRKHPTAKLLKWQQGKHLKRLVRVKGYQTPVVPDGFFSIQFSDRPAGSNTAHFFLEADRSTMPRKRFHQKLLAYQTYFETGQHTEQHQIKGFRVLTITISPERRQSLRVVATAPDLAELATAFWFACEKDFDPFKPETILKPIWVTGKHLVPQTLLPS